MQKKFPKTSPKAQEKFSKSPCKLNTKILIRDLLYKAYWQGYQDGKLKLFRGNPDSSYDDWCKRGDSHIEEEECIPYTELMADIRKVVKICSNHNYHQ